MTEQVPSITDLGIDQGAASRLLPHLDSFVKWEMLRFFHDNPMLEAAVEDLARYTGRDETEVKPAASALHTAGLLRQQEEESGYAYALTGDEVTRGMIDHLVEGFVADRLIRLAISAHILKAHREGGKVSQMAG